MSDNRHQNVYARIPERNTIEWKDYKQGRDGCKVAECLAALTTVIPVKSERCRIMVTLKRILMQVDEVQESWDNEIDRGTPGTTLFKDEDLLMDIDFLLFEIINGVGGRLPRREHAMAERTGVLIKRALKRLRGNTFSLQLPHNAADVRKLIGMSLWVQEEMDEFDKVKETFERVAVSDNIESDVQCDSFLEAFEKLAECYE